MESWCFAYGSNLCVNQLAARIGPFDRSRRPPRIVRLAEYRLTYQPTEAGGESYANIVSPGDGVLGVVYWFSHEQFDRLDDHEDGYDRRAVIVIDEAGEVLEAIAYVMRPFTPATASRPTREYVNTIVSGARRHGLPESYVAHIAALALAARPIV